MASPSRYLLIIGCSQRKISNVGSFRAIELYDGVNFRVLRKAKRDGYLPSCLDVMILSAKYDLVNSDTILDAYDLRMTRTQALKLQPEVSKKLDEWLKLHNYQEVFINMGKIYLLALAQSQELKRISERVQYAPGGIGQKMAAMKEWLLRVSEV